MRTRKTTRKARTQLAALMADLGGMMGVNPDKFNAFPFSLILDKALQLKEAPIANPIVHYFPFSLFSYPLKVFHHNLVSIEFGNNIFTYVMVNPLHPTSFSPRKLLEKPFAGTSAFALKFGTQIFELSLDLLNFGRIIKPAARSNSKVIYSEVNAQNNILRNVVNGINLFRERKQEESPTFIVYTQKTFAYFPRKIFFVTFGDIELELLPFIEQSQYKNIIFKIRTSLEIIPYRSTFDDWLGFSLFNHATCLLNTSNSKLGWQGLSQSFINKGMELDIIANFILPSSIDAKVQSFSISLYGIDDFWSCIDFNFSCYNTTHNNYKTINIFNYCGDLEYNGGEWANSSPKQAMGYPLPIE